MYPKSKKEYIYVFLYQNLNEGRVIAAAVPDKIYVFLYQNLNAIFSSRVLIYISNLCISILEFKC